MHNARRIPRSPGLFGLIKLSLAAASLASVVERARAQNDYPYRTELISANSAAEQGNRDSFTPSISGDGRWVAFASRATDLAPRDRNNSEDVFVHDRTTGQTRLVSVSSNGVPGNDDSFRPMISRDGRFVVFQSDSTNLVPGDDNGATDIFLYELAGGRTTLVSVDSQGRQGDGDSVNPSISDDGQVIAFHSYAGNLDAGDTNRDRDVFVHDRKSGQTRRIATDRSSFGELVTWDAAIAGNGRFVAFTGAALGVDGDVNPADGIFVYDRVTSQTVRVSVDADGTPGDRDSFDPSISADGRYVAFASDASNLVDDDTSNSTVIFVHDRRTRTTRRITVESDGGRIVGDSHDPVISADGQFIVYWSRIGTRAARDSNDRHDVFVYDRATGQTRGVSVSSSGRLGNGHSEAPAISADGQFLAFESRASNLVLCDRNRRDDVFVHGPGSCDGRITGDSNGDGAVDARDTDAFVMAVTDPCRYQVEFSQCDLLCNNDINGDGDVDFFDIGEFIELVYNR